MSKCGKRYLFSSERLVKRLCYVNVPFGCIIDMDSEINSALRMEPTSDFLSGCDYFPQ